MNISLNKKIKALSQERQKLIQDRANTLIRQQLVAQIHELLTPNLIGTDLFLPLNLIFKLHG